MLVCLFYEAKFYHRKFPTDLKMEPFHIVTMANRRVSQTATSLCDVFIELPNPAALVCPP